MKKGEWGGQENERDGGREAEKQLSVYVCVCLCMRESEWEMRLSNINPMNS